MKKIIFSLIIFLCFSFNINALCYDSGLNDWSENVEVKFIEFDGSLPNELDDNKPLSETMNYAYILSLSEYRDDIVMKATNNYNQNLEWEYIPGHKVWGIVNYNAKDEVNYDITIYGAKNSACPDKIIKTLTYKLDPLNLYIKTEYCENYPEAPMCKTYKDTSDVTFEEFKDVMQDYEKEHSPAKQLTIMDKIFDYIYQYAIYILVPFVFISIFYIIKINNVRREERSK